MQLENTKELTLKTVKSGTELKFASYFIDELLNDNSPMPSNLERIKVTKFGGHCRFF